MKRASKDLPADLGEAAEAVEGAALVAELLDSGALCREPDRAQAIASIGAICRLAARRLRRVSDALRECPGRRP